MDDTISKNNDLMFNGRLNGDIAAAGELTLGPSADIHGEVRARSLKLSGKIRGNVFIGDTCKIFSSAVLIGDSEANRLVCSCDGPFSVYIWIRHTSLFRFSYPLWIWRTLAFPLKTDFLEKVADAIC